jgi:carbon-monoxide dehydrogenase large subunit
MEPRSVVVDPSGGEWTMYSATQIPHVLRFLLSATDRHPGAQDPGDRAGRRRRVRRQARRHAEEWIAFAVSTKVNRPVKYTETRSESLLSAHHGRDMIQDITVTATRDGIVTGLSSS